MGYEPGIEKKHEGKFEDDHRDRDCLESNIVKVLESDHYGLLQKEIYLIQVQYFVILRELFYFQKSTNDNNN